MTQKELNEKVQLLKAGQIVQISGDYFQAKHIPDCYGVYPCNYCDLDSICRGDIAIICEALDSFGKRQWFLKLAHA